MSVCVHGSLARSCVECELRALQDAARRAKDSLGSGTLKDGYAYSVLCEALGDKPADFVFAKKSQGGRPPSIWDGPDDDSPDAFERWSQLVDMRLQRSSDPDTAERAKAALRAVGRADLVE